MLVLSHGGSVVSGTSLVTQPGPQWMDRLLPQHHSWGGGSRALAGAELTRLSCQPMVLLRALEPHLVLRPLACAPLGAAVSLSWFVHPQGKLPSVMALTISSPTIQALQARSCPVPLPKPSRSCVKGFIPAQREAARSLLEPCPHAALDPSLGCRCRVKTLPGTHWLHLS